MNRIGIPILPPNANDAGLWVSLPDKLTVATPAIPPRNIELGLKYDCALVRKPVESDKTKINVSFFIIHLCLIET